MSTFILQLQICLFFCYNEDGDNMNNKTNVMRILDQARIPYQVHSYIHTTAISGMEVASILGEDPNQTFKTLVTIGKSKKYYVFVVPVNKELDLKKAAQCVEEKNIEMIKSKDLLAVTGYIHGGCSPIGMKKKFPTIFDQSAENYETILFSAGKIGYQVEVSLSDIASILSFQLRNIVVD